MRVLPERRLSTKELTLSNCGAGEPLDRKENKPVYPKRNHPWIFNGRTDAEAPILWPPAAKNRLTGNNPDAGKDWRQEEKQATEDEMVGWHHQLNGHKSMQTPEHSEGQGSLTCCSPWGHKESDTTDWPTTTYHVHKLEDSIFKRCKFCPILIYRFNAIPIKNSKESPGIPMVSTLRSHCQGCKFHPWSGN